jgi:hypothetical protein
MPATTDGNLHCAAEATWPAADLREQAVLATSGVALIAAGLWALRRNRPGWVPAWTAALAAWATIPKYFICTRCENYGKPCDFFFGGEYAALLFKQQDKPFNLAGYFAEGVPLGIFLFLPAIAARRDLRALSLYALAGAAFQALLVKICCIDCVNNARDTWKADYCPTYKLIAASGLASPPR